MIGLVLVCWDGTRPAGPPSSHLDKRPAPVECRGMPAPEMGTRREEKRQAGREATCEGENERASERTSEGRFCTRDGDLRGKSVGPNTEVISRYPERKSIRDRVTEQRDASRWLSRGRLLASRKRERETVGFPPAFQRLLRLVDRGIIERGGEKELRNGERNVATGTSDATVEF